MAFETFSFTAFVSLVLLLLPYLFHSILAHAVVQKQSPFHFIKHLQGCKKGERMRGICQLKSIGIFFYCMDIARLATNLLEKKKKQQRGIK
jgi:hypothetical protein